MSEEGIMASFTILDEFHIHPNEDFIKKADESKMDLRRKIIMPEKNNIRIGC